MNGCEFRKSRHIRRRDYEASTNLYPHFRHLLTDMDEIWKMRAAGNAAEWFLSFVKIGKT
jgi:hypothetical protein